ncbi:DNA adenine methylase [Clostridium autoethanogenum]|uniref:Site-specific DNA-methyltransferase (adenine-specific) n=1 Tax=Clostridium autoethanogenum TaxID=84023 RepID=A0A3M0T4H5_9CLOT|nr:Dam family site-specific DNA-(adenine-N6)-methyltransferase [Clostridium autoethanogenum]RMD04892.1 DNA adenine methylase [Clostridium autoethanogenum]
MNSFIGWIGGKKLLRKEIVKRFPEKFDRYIEVFGGAAWVLFSKDKLANMEIYNDANSDLVNLFRCVKYHSGELQKELSFMLNSRELFCDFISQYNTRGMTDIQRAARFFMLIKTSYGSDHKSYGCVKKDVNVMIKYLTKIQERLSGVVIENKDFQDLLRVYDKGDGLIYLDPPYYGTERYYQAKFSEEDHMRLYDCLNNVKGKFILSYNDCEFIRDLYKNFNIDEVVRNHNLVGKYKNKDHKYSELIIRNY